MVEHVGKSLHVVVVIHLHANIIAQPAEVEFLQCKNRGNSND